MNKKKIHIDRRVMWGLFILLQLLLVGTAFVAGVLSDQWYFSSKSDYPLLQHAMDIVKKHSYYELPAAQKLEYGMIRGMLQAVNDPFTIFVEPPQAELQTNQLQGKFGGIGVRMEQDSQQQKTFLYPLPDSPAARAGIQEGDYLAAVDELQIGPNTSLDEIQAAIRGPVDSIVKITVGRGAENAIITLEVKRAEVSLPSVTWNLAAGNAQVGVIQINVIAETTPDEVSKAIEELQARGAQAFVLDVRNNGGGLVDAGVKTAQLFLTEGIVIEQQFRDDPVQTYKVEEPGKYAELPVVFLVNKGTASAAEILAGALQGQNRAKLVGSPTYGKDSIQLVFDMEDGSSLHVTAARWWVPGLNKEIKGSGLQPDVLIEEGQEGTMLQKAIEILFAR